MSGSRGRPSADQLALDGSVGQRAAPASRGGPEELVVDALISAPTRERLADKARVLEYLDAFGDDLRKLRERRFVHVATIKRLREGGLDRAHRRVAPVCCRPTGTEPALHRFLGDRRQWQRSEPPHLRDQSG